MRLILSLALGVTALLFPKTVPARTADPPPNKFVAVDTSCLMGSPTPPLQYELTPAFPQLSFEFPLVLTSAPDGTNRLFLVGQNGVIYVFPNRADVRPDEVKTFLDLRGGVARNYFEEGLIGLAFHPRFSENGQFFIYYTERPTRSSVARFTVSPDNPNRADPTSQQVILTVNQPFWNHNSGTIQFGPDGFLYIPLGDGGSANDPHSNGQNLQSLLGKILRIDVDHADPGKNYAIPEDNPFVHLGDKARGEIWALGLRNPWTMMFDRKTGDLWVADVGQDHWEEVDVIVRGGNYGWNVREGFHTFPAGRKPGPQDANFIDPVWEYPHSEGVSITGGSVYRGARHSNLRGWYICADHMSGSVWALRRRDGEEPQVRKIAYSPFPISAFGEDASGEQYLIAFDEFTPVPHGNTTTQGQIYRLQPATFDHQYDPKKFPRLLSETGLFTSVSNHQVAPGLIPYDVNVPLWSDGAVKDRYLALPEKGQVVFSPKDDWDFPIGTVTVKTFSLEMHRGDPTSLRRLETRLMVRSDRGWDGYTYRWNDQQTDATLLDGSLEEVFEIKTDEGTETQTWYYPSHYDCNACHTKQENFSLGLVTRQLNRPSPAGSQENQLDRFDRLGLFRNPPTAPASTLEALPDWTAAEDSTSDLARAYLDANCAMCHQPGGNSVMQLDFRYHTPLAEANIINVPRQSLEELPNQPMLIDPGNAEKSELVARVSRRGPGQMPRLATNRVDKKAVEILRRWIADMHAQQPDN